MEIPHYLPESRNTEQKKGGGGTDFAHISHAQRRLEVPVVDITMYHVLPFLLTRFLSY